MKKTLPAISKEQGVSSVYIKKRACCNGSPDIKDKGISLQKRLLLTKQKRGVLSMKFKTIESTGASYFFDSVDNTLYLEGTNKAQWKDFLAVALTMFKHRLYIDNNRFGYVAKGAYNQAFSVLVSIAGEIDSNRVLTVKGKSLGTYGQILIALLIRHQPNLTVHGQFYGPWNCIDKRLKFWLDTRPNIMITNYVNHFDPVPHIQLWSRSGLDVKQGRYRKWWQFFDFNLVSGSHSQYRW